MSKPFLGVRKMIKGRDYLTGKVFESVRFDGHTVIENESFQLEAVLEGEVTRLQAKGSAPQECLYDKRHSGLELRDALESLPPIYLVGCNCGYTVGMKDVNEGFRYSGKFE